MQGRVADLLRVAADAQLLSGAAGALCTISVLLRNWQKVTEMQKPVSTLRNMLAWKAAAVEPP